MNSHKPENVVDLIKSIIAHTHMDQAKADKMANDLTLAWLTNISSGLLDTVPEGKRTKYGHILERITQLDSSNQKEMVVKALEQFMSQFTPEQFQYVYIHETMPMLRELLESIAPSLDDKTRADLESQIDALLPE